MESLFLAFANSQSAPLPTLREEDDEACRLLSRRAGQGHYALHRDSYASLPKVAGQLLNYRDSLALFLFSGHAGRDRLLLEDQGARAEGIAELLALCPRLKLVVLNGCSTKGQVARLLALPNRPAVIATSAPVGDRAATQFSVTFFQALAEQSATVEEAFRAGVAAAKAAAKEPFQVLEARNLALRSPKEPAWGLFTAEGFEDRRGWKLPLPGAGEPQAAAEPNQYLIKGLLNSLAPFDQEVRQLQQEQQLLVAVPGVQQKPPERKRKNAILKCLPFPISVHLQKLMAKRRASMEGHDFYDEFGIKRLEQLINTYNTVIELPAFVVLAQLWDALTEKQKPQIEDQQRTVVRQYLQAPHEERVKKWFFPLMKTVAEIFIRNQRPFFVGELAQLPAEADGPFYNALMALELKKERLAARYPYTEGELAEECLDAEEKLAAILHHLSFLAGYSLVSVRNIDVLRNRQMRTPNYLHRLVRLVQHFSEDPTEEVELLDYFLDNASVLMMRKAGEEGQARFLNLTPFVVDENAFVEKAADHKLFYFYDYEPRRPAYRFQHIYKPKDPPLEACEGARLQHLMYQFQVFWNLLDHKNGSVS